MTKKLKRTRLTRRKKRSSSRTKRGGDPTSMSGSVTLYVDGHHYTFKSKPEGFEEFMTEAKNFITNTNLAEKSYEENMTKLIELCKQYEQFIGLQEFNSVMPGDIVYYSVGHLGYAAGHVETVLGTTSRKNGSNSIIRPVPNGKGGYTIWEMLVDPTEVDKEITVFRYKGQYANLIRATAAFLNNLFISQNNIHYGKVKDFCKIVFSRCDDHLDKEKRMKDLENLINGMLTKHETHDIVCSGLSILMFQLAFVIHGLDNALHIAMPFNASGCSPLQLKNWLKASNTSWEIHTFPKIINKFTYSHTSIENISCLFHVSDLDTDPQTIKQLFNKT
jgi:uncharacterized protein YsxB (DUF464 family)